MNAASAGAQTDGSVQMTAVWFGFESGTSILRMETGGRDEGQKEGKAFKRSVWVDQIVAAFKIKQHKYYMNQSKQMRRNDAGKGLHSLCLTSPCSLWYSIFKCRLFLWRFRGRDL